MYIKTTYILGIITVVDLIWGSKGDVSFLLWITYGLYKLVMNDQ